MMRGEKYAWVVIVPNDDLVRSALLSGGMLQQLPTSGSVVALMSSRVSMENVQQLKSAFDLTLVTKMEIDMTSDRLEILERDALLVECLNMTLFSKLVVLNPGVLTLRQMDDLFDTVGFVEDKNGSWEVMCIQPNSEKYASALVVLQKESYKFAEMTQALFGRLKDTCQITGASVLSSQEFNTFVGADDEVAFVKTERDIVDEIFNNDNDLDKLENALSTKISALKRVVSPNQRLSSQRTKEATNNNDTKNWIAVVGMACRFPQANSVEEYWKILESGRNTSTSLPEDRVPLSNIEQNVKGNFLKCRIDEFDAPFFGLSPSEATFTDVQTRLLLEVSWEAFEDAGINPDKLRNSKTGVFYGSWLQEYKDMMNTECSPPGDDFLRKYLGNSFGSTGAKLSFFYGFTGPNIATESGCSSSIMSVDLACKSLQRGECPVALAAGTNILLQLDLTKKLVWAEDGICRTFDACGNGYGRAEGVGVLILKRYADAIRDNDNIHGIIRGSWTAQEGLSRSFGTPTIESETMVMRNALMVAKVDPGDVDYLEAHATGTEVGDPIEAAAIVNAYQSAKQRAQPLWIASGKTNIGHTESCSGIAGIIKVLLSMKHGKIPPHINFQTLNPKINFDSIPGEIPLALTPWLRFEGKPRLAGVSSFGITGTDVHMILQEGPQACDSSSIANEPACSSSAHLHHILTWSAKCESALDDLTRSYLDLLRNPSSEPLSNLVSSSNACRAHHPHRRAVVGCSAEMMANLIEEQSYISGKAMLNGSSGKQSKICFAFPGLIGKMDLEPALVLYRTCPLFRSHMNHCNAIFKELSGEVLLSCFDDKLEGGTNSGMMVYYACYLALQYSLVKLWESWGVHPSLILGHCVGEIGAAVTSGSLSLEDGFKIITTFEHAAQLSKQQPGLMLALNSGVDKVQKLITIFQAENEGLDIDVAGVNSPTQTTVVGSPEGIQLFKGFSTNNGIPISRLIDVHIPLHSERRMAKAVEDSRETIYKVTHYPSKLPHASSVTGRVIEAGGTLEKDYWLKCFQNPVQFREACSAVRDEQTTTFIEIGLGQSLTKLIEENMSTKKKEGSRQCLPTFRNNKQGDKCWAQLLETLAQLHVSGTANIDWTRFYGGNKRRRVTLPRYPFQRKSYWFEKTEGRRHHHKMYFYNELQANSHFEQIHPLLGSKAPNPSENELFQNWISERTAPFIFEHQIGNEVIFPAAAFLEIMLAVGRHKFLLDDNDDKKKSLTVHNFNVLLPLHLESSSSSPGGNGKLVQTMVHQEDKDNRNSFNVSIHSFSNDEWKLHASATVVASSTELGDLDRIDIDCIKTSNLDLKTGSERFYAEARDVGLNFGPEFQSLHEIYKNPGETLAKIKFPQDDPQYICHPIVSDAMIQCFILHTKPELKKLHVPVRVGQFTCRRIATDNSLELYAYCASSGPGSSGGVPNSVLLLDNFGTIVGSMEQPDLAPTTVESVLKAAGVATTTNFQGTPDAYKIEWERSVLHQPSFTTTSGLAQVRLASGNIFEGLDAFNEFTLAEKQMDTDINRLCFLYVLRALHEMGWQPAVGETIDLEKMMTVQFGVIASLAPAFRHYMTFLVEYEVLGERSSSTADQGEVEYFVRKEGPPTRENVEREIRELVNLYKNYEPIGVIHSCGSQLAQILQGTVTGQYLLFGDSSENGENPAEFYYRTSRLNVGLRQALDKVFTPLASQIHASSSSQVIRILEVGAGTGSFTKDIVSKMEEHGVSYQYFFTDISSSCFGRAREKFSEHKANFIFKTLDIGRDPLSQDFPPNYFDIVVGVDVFHATKNLTRTLGHVETLTKQNGFLIIGDADESHKEIDIVFGILDGYWLFEDKDLRPTHCIVSSDKWLETMHATGFTRSNQVYVSKKTKQSVIVGQLEQLKDDSSLMRRRHVSKSSNRNWLIFHDDEHYPDFLLEQIAKYGRRATTFQLEECRKQDNIQNWVANLIDNVQGALEGILYISGGAAEPESSRRLLEPLLHISKYLHKSKSKQLPKLHVVTRGCWNVGEEETLIDGKGPLGAILWGFMRCLRIELARVPSKSIDLDPDADECANYANLWNELWLDDKETEIMFRKEVRLVRRLKNDDLSTSSALSIPTSAENRYTIELPNSRILSDLTYVPKQVGELEENNIEVEVRCASLNFRDVFAVMKPSEKFEGMDVIGLDFSGIVSSVGGNVTRWKVGDPVFGGFWSEGAITSHLQGDANLVMRVPNNLTFAEAATLPAVFITAWHCIVNVANLKSGQTMLLHAASGGVGLIAMQIAKYLGVHVIATAGNSSKRNFVRCLGAQHVFNSRSVEFERKVLEVTNGRGVDMVLNCLTGPGFKEASLSVLREGGHFVEISKLDIWQPHEVEQLKPSVHYKIVDAADLELFELKDIMGKLTKFLEEGTITPLPYTRFSACNIVDALTYLQKAKQVGKVIVEMPRYKLQTNEFKDYLLNDRSTYLITGGLGAIGMAVAKWMVSQGAKFIVLAGRSPPTESNLEEIGKLEDAGGSTVICKQADISKYEECRRLLLEMEGEKKLPPLRGIHHCSGVLSDKLISSEEQDWANFEYVLAPKVSGAYNLHHLTLHCRLEHFVLYSSICCTFGYIGQSNYAAGNAYMDSLVELRSSMRLKGTSINWGNWRIGLAENKDVQLVLPFSLEQGIAALDRICRRNQVSPIIGNLRTDELPSLYPFYIGTFLDKIDSSQKAGTKNKTRSKNVKSERLASLKSLFAERKDEQDGTQIVRNCVVEILCEILGLKRDDEVDEEADFNDMGMDSLMSIEFTNKLQAELQDVPLGFLDMEENGTVCKMTRLVMSVLESH